eukprot:TRINITY_DN691_c0_g3_i3.p1 TRINITY_DN691_c0_g3~~TRINITY_DN691_c0_g3_i3.p1  ORF type:complete len:1756 (+),score=397.13 TRINITY_DN691_c0_g3_i3:113-5269(+)
MQGASGGTPPGRMVSAVPQRSSLTGPFHTVQIAQVDPSLSSSERTQWTVSVPPGQDGQSMNSQRRSLLTVTSDAVPTESDTWRSDATLIKPMPDTVPFTTSTRSGSISRAEGSTSSVSTIPTSPRRPRGAAFRFRNIDVYEGGGYLTKPIKEKETAEASGAGLRIGIAAMQGWRKTMEDAHCANVNHGDGSAFVGIFDGHCGPVVAKLLPDLLPGEVQRQLAALPDRLSAFACCEAVRNAFVDVDARILKSCDSGGSTAVIFVRTSDGRYISANAGDARCVLCRGGAAVPLTSDHKPQLASEQRRVVQARGEIIDGRVAVSGQLGRLAVSRAFGDAAFKCMGGHLSMQPVTAAADVAIATALPSDEFVLLACDGVWERMDSEQAVSFVRARLQQGAGPVAAAAGLCDACCADIAPGRGCDNITAAVVVLEQQRSPAERASLTTTNLLLKQEWEEVREAHPDALAGTDIFTVGLPNMALPHSPTSDNGIELHSAMTEHSPMQTLQLSEQSELQETQIAAASAIVEPEGPHSSPVAGGLAWASARHPAGSPVRPGGSVSRRSRTSQSLPEGPIASPASQAMMNAMKTGLLTVQVALSEGASDKATRSAEDETAENPLTVPERSGDKSACVQNEARAPRSPDPAHSPGSSWASMTRQSTAKCLQPPKQVVLDPGERSPPQPEKQRPRGARYGLVLPGVLSAGMLLCGAVFFLAAGCMPAGIACLCLSLCSAGLAACWKRLRHAPESLAPLLLLGVLCPTIAADAVALGNLDGWVLALPWVAAAQSTASAPMAAASVGAVLLWLLARLSEHLWEYGLLVHGGPAPGSWERAVGVTIVRSAALFGCVAVLLRVRWDRSDIAAVILEVNECARAYDLAGAELAVAPAPPELRHALLLIVDTIRSFQTAAMQRERSTSDERCWARASAASENRSRAAASPPGLLNLPNHAVMPPLPALALQGAGDEPSYPRSPRRSVRSSLSKRSGSGSTSNGSCPSPRARFTSGAEDLLEESHIMAKSPTALASGLQPKDAAVLRTDILLEMIDTADLVTAVGIWNHVVLEAAEKTDGVLLSSSGTSVSIVWNAQSVHNAPAASACTCATMISQGLAGCTRGNSLWYTVAISVGSVLVGALNRTQGMEIPVVVGPPLHFAGALCRLGRQVRARILMGERAYAQVRAEYFARPVDAVRDIPQGQPSGNMSPVSCASDDPDHEKGTIVYELLGHRDAITNRQREHNLLFVEGFSFMRALRFQDARVKLLQFLKLYPKDEQAQRILRISCWAASKGGRHTGAYSREWVGWEDFEGLSAEVDLDEDLLQVASRRVMPHGAREFADFAVGALERSPTGGSGGLNPAYSPRALGHLGRRQSVQHDVMLRRAIRDAEAEANADQLAAWGIMPVGAPPTPRNDGPKGVPLRIRDFKSRLWQRSEKCLGKGAFGEVWLGMGSDGALVAIKCMKLPTLASMKPDQPAAAVQQTAAARRRLARAQQGGSGGSAQDQHKAHLRQIDELLQEVALMQQLRHENVVAYLASALVDGYVMIIMEYLSGGSLFSVMKEFGDAKLPLTSVQRYLRDIVRGLAFLHQHEIVHRDMKPHNVLLGIDGQCKLADFGASAKLSQLNATNQGLIGTPLYMAPEACRGAACKASDIWALGVILCQVCCGSVPYAFTSEDPFQPQTFIFKLGRVEGYGPQIPNDLPVECRGFVEHCLRQDPLTRPTAEELLDNVFLLQ